MSVNRAKPINGYQERVRQQTLNWAQGRPVHNRIDNECCPDFSCCNPALFEKDEATRWRTYHKCHGRMN